MADNNNLSIIIAGIYAALIIKGRKTFAEISDVVSSEIQTKVKEKLISEGYENLV